MRNDKKIFAGIDVGSLTAEAVIIDDRDNILAWKIIPAKPSPEQSATEALNSALLSSGLEKGNIDSCFSTGYGRDNISFSKKNISEISCHGRGAHFLSPGIRTIIDIGGQDCKVIKIDKDGYLEDFVMNDKCAAGTGRFLEIMAKTLGVDISELGNLSLKSKKPVPLSSSCAIFTEIEVIELLYSGKRRKHIAAGIHLALVRRLKSLVKRVGLRGDVCMTGGGAKNQGLVWLLESELGVKFTPLSLDPQVAGALGAALFARDTWIFKSRKAA